MRSAAFKICTGLRSYIATTLIACRNLPITTERFEPVAGYVADGKQHAVIVEIEGVVPVASNLHFGGGGTVDSAQRGAFHAGQS